MIGQKTAVFPDDSVYNGFFAIHDSYFLHNYELKILHLKKRKHPDLKDFYILFQKITDCEIDFTGLDLKIWNEKITIIDIPHQTKGKLNISVSDPSIGQVQIILNYVIVENYGHAEKIATLKEIINKSIRDFQAIKTFHQEANGLHAFIKPHLESIKTLNSNMRKAISGDYKRRGDIIELDDKKINRQLIKIYHHEGKRIKRVDAYINGKNRIKLKLINNDIWQIISPNLNQIPKYGYVIITIEHQNPKYHYLGNEVRKLRNQKRGLYNVVDNANLASIMLLKKLIKYSKEKISKERAENLIKHSSISEKTSKLGEVWKEYQKHLQYLSEDQKKGIKICFKSPISVIGGKYGTGKTEVAAWIALLYALAKKRILIVCETNNAVNNMLSRIQKFGRKIGLKENEINISRITARSHNLPTDLKKYHFQRKANMIYNKIQRNSIVEENHKKTIEQHKPLFSNFNTVKNMLLFISNIVVTTFGKLSSTNHFQGFKERFDLIISDASNLTKFSVFSIGAGNADKWLIIGDQNQIKPLNENNFILSQHIRFPTNDELKAAKKVDFTDLQSINPLNRWINKKYHDNILDLFLDDFQFQQFNLYTELAKQHRIHPEIYHSMQKIFDNKNSFQNTSLEENGNHIWVNLKPIQIRKRINYITSKDEELVYRLVQELKSLIEGLVKAELYKKKGITIGITGSNYDLVNKIFDELQNRFKNSSCSISESIKEPIIIDWIKIELNSIISHEELEFDLMFIAINNFYQPDFENRLKTAISRAKSYVFLFSEKVQLNKSKRKKSKYYNLKLVEDLQNA